MIIYIEKTCYLGDWLNTYKCSFGYEVKVRNAIFIVWRVYKQPNVKKKWIECNKNITMIK